MSERLTADISRDLRASAQDMRAEHRNTDAGLLAEAADKLDGLIALLAEAETERDEARAQDCGHDLEAFQRQAEELARLRERLDTAQTAYLVQAEELTTDRDRLAAALWTYGSVLRRLVLLDGDHPVQISNRATVTLSEIIGWARAALLDTEPQHPAEVERDRLAAELAEIRALRAALLATTGASSRLAATVQRVWALTDPRRNREYVDRKFILAALDGAQLPEAGEPGSNLGADDPIETGAEAALGEPRRKIAEVRAIHQQYRTAWVDWDTCAGCNQGMELVRWPCPTIAALDASPGAESGQRDDDLAEIDTTEEEIDRQMAEGVPVEIVGPVQTIVTSKPTKRTWPPSGYLCRARGNVDCPGHPSKWMTCPSAATETGDDRG